MDLSYTFSNVNALTAIADADDALYSCAVTSDANNNITAVQETATVGAYTADLYTYFTYDWANRLGNWWVRAYDSGQKDWQLTRREHGYDAAGRLINSTYKQWWEAGEEPAGDSVEHAYAGSRHVQNFDGDASYGAVWHWAGAQNSFAAPVKSPNPDTASQAAFNIANDKTPQRKTWQNPTTAGDARNLFGQGKPMPKDSSGAGADWGTGIESYTTEATVLQIESRLDFDGTVAPTDLDRATDAREKSRIGIFGSALSYAGSSGRVTSEPLGRDLNPLGRGSGAALVGGAMNLGHLTPRLPGSQASGGTGNSVNNCGQCGGGGSPDLVPPNGGTPTGDDPPPYHNQGPLPPKEIHDEDKTCGCLIGCMMGMAGPPDGPLAPDHPCNNLCRGDEWTNNYEHCCDMACACCEYWDSHELCDVYYWYGCKDGSGHGHPNYGKCGHWKYQDPPILFSSVQRVPCPPGGPSYCPTSDKCDVEIWLSAFLCVIDSWGKRHTEIEGRVVTTKCIVVFPFNQVSSCEWDVVVRGPCEICD